MVCYTLEEQNDTTNEFLDVVDANDMLRELNNIFEHCKPSDRQDRTQVGKKRNYKKKHLFYYAGRPLFNTYYFSVYLGHSYQRWCIEKNNEMYENY